MVIFCLMRRLILRTNYLSKKMLNDIENKVLDLHEKFKEKFGVNKHENLVGANLYFNNIYEKSIVSSLNINGKSEQNGTPTPDEPVEIKSVEGIENLFDYEDESNYVETTNSSIEKINNGIRVTNKIAGTYKFARYKIENNIVKTMLGKTYTFSCDFTASGSNNGLVAIYWSNSNNSTFSNISSLNISGNYITFTLPSEIPTGAEYISLLFYSNRNSSTIVVGDYVDYTNIQMTEGSITYDYVPYGHWLTVTNTGKNFLNLPDGTYTNNGITAVVKDGIITLNGTATATSFITINNVFNYTFKANQKYTISFNNKTLISDTNARFRFSKNGGFDVVKDFYFNNINSSQTFYFTKDTEVEWIQIRTGVNITYDNFIIFPQLEEGSTATEYEPYKEQSTLIDMNKPNLFDKDNANILNLYPGSTFGSNTLYQSICISIKPNTTYTLISLNHYSDGLALGTSEEYPVAGGTVTNKTSVGKTKNNVTITSGANDKYLLAYIKWTGTLTEEILNGIKIYKGIGTDDYYELSSIGDTKDELNIDKDGNVSITQNIGEVVLNGSESLWGKSGNSTESVFVATLGLNYENITSKGGTRDQWLTNYFHIGALGTENTFLAYNEDTTWGYRNLGFSISTSLVNDIGTWKTWLSNNPVTVKYILDKPQTISLGKITPLKLLEGTNNITNNDELQPNMTSSINCLNLVETSLRNIKVNDYLNNKTIHLSFPFESYESITSELPFVSLDDEKFLCRKVSSGGNQYIGYKYKGHYNFLYYKYTNKKSVLYNYIRYKLPNDYGKVSSINENDIFYKFVKIKDDEYKLQEYNKKTWVDNEIPYLQYIDNIEEGINNVAEILYKPLGYEYKKWTTTGYYGIKSNDYGLAQKPISSKDFDRWNKNIKLLNSIISNVINIWNLVSFIDWNEESQFEWEEN